MVPKILVFLALLLQVSITSAQSLDSLELVVKDTLNIEGQDSTIYEKPKAGIVSNFVFQFDNRNERYYETRARMNGVKIGLEFYKRVRLGFGVYGNNNFYQINFPAAQEDHRFSGRMNYVTTFGEAVFYRSFRWELSSSIARGRGQILLNTYDASTSIPELTRSDTISDIRLYDFGAHSQFKIFPWFGLGVGVGYRTLNLPSHPELQGLFSDPYVDFKIKVFLGYAIKGIFSPEKIKAERLYYEQRSRMRRAKFRAKFLDR